MRMPGAGLFALRKLAGMTTGPRSPLHRERGIRVPGLSVAFATAGSRSAWYVLAIGDRVGGHTNPVRAGVCSAGESSSWPGQTTVTRERFRRFR
jgi:hypothetical protein